MRFPVSVCHLSGGSRSTRAARGRLLESSTVQSDGPLNLKLPNKTSNNSSSTWWLDRSAPGKQRGPGHPLTWGHAEIPHKMSLSSFYYSCPSLRKHQDDTTKCPSATPSGNRSFVVAQPSRIQHRGGPKQVSGTRMPHPCPRTPFVSSSRRTATYCGGGRAERGSRGSPIRKLDRGCEGVNDEGQNMNPSWLPRASRPHNVIPENGRLGSSQDLYSLPQRFLIPHWNYWWR